MKTKISNDLVVLEIKEREESGCQYVLRNFQIGRKRTVLLNCLMAMPHLYLDCKEALLKGACCTYFRNLGLLRLT